MAIEPSELDPIDPHHADIIGKPNKPTNNWKTACIGLLLPALIATVVTAVGLGIHLSDQNRRLKARVHNSQATEEARQAQLQQNERGIVTLVWQYEQATGPSHPDALAAATDVETLKLFIAVRIYANPDHSTGAAIPASLLCQIGPRAQPQFRPSSRPAHQRHPGHRHPPRQAQLTNQLQRSWGMDARRPCPILYHMPNSLTQTLNTIKIH
jgi:hypothetical protein